MHRTETSQRIIHAIQLIALFLFIVGLVALAWFNDDSFNKTDLFKTEQPTKNRTPFSGEFTGWPRG